MRDIPVQFSDDDCAALEQIRRQQGLSTIEQAAEWLAKSCIRNGAKTLSGRGRALYDVGTKPT